MKIILNDKEKFTLEYKEKKRMLNMKLDGMSTKTNEQI
jgi:hypothetical protein